MIAFLRELIFRDFWLKLFSLALAVLIWLTVSFAIQKEGSPATALILTPQERTFSNLPVLVMSSAQDVRNIRVNPNQVEVTVRGDPKTVRGLQASEIRVIVDLTGIETAHDLQKRIEVSTPAGISHVAVMPDVHYGIGATVGSVIATTQAVMPAAVGVDIGCGMAAVRTNLTSHDFASGDAAAVRHSIERGVPVGFRSHGEPRANAMRLAAESGLRNLGTKELCQLGTLGGGNHFIELSTDEDDRVWIVLHSGSRNFGKRLPAKPDRVYREADLDADCRSRGPGSRPSRPCAPWCWW